MKLLNLFNRKGLLFFAVLILFCLLYFQTFTADFAYLDEIHQLWHNQGKSNYLMFLTQGRWLTGLLFQKFFSSISGIEQLKWFRIFSLAGWVVTAWMACLLFKRWALLLHLQSQTLLLGGLCTVCSLSVCIYIGWASCMEVFAAVALGLLSGHVFFTPLIRQKEVVQFSAGVMLLSLLLGVTALFIYQTAYGIFLLPFYLQYVKQKTPKPHKTIIIGVAFYLITYVVYYFLFKYSLQLNNTVASDRTGIHLDVLGKIGFFFSGPLPQAFSLNLPFSASSIFSQVFYPLVLLVWVFCLFKNNRQNTVLQNAGKIGGIFILLFLIYLPLMVAVENFASYRTLFAFNLAVFMMMVEEVMTLVKKKPTKNGIAAALAALLLGTAFYTFNYLYVNPLQQEYKALRSYIETHYNPSIKNVYFIRAGKHLFSSTYGTKVYRDELGLPSTYRDWVPVPIIKQLVLEQTGQRLLAEQLNVVQFEDATQFEQSHTGTTPNDLVIDMNAIYTNSLE